ncbi:hypothetical protein TOPH_03980 [Tolypocladium ophioglossoides CBS 100239]|uniref:Autophagy-related protein 14 n=1 Tax=Tolypocladium ophioglossoides (strain CBS 100239) TaxID=1163406 RepID=A0A0L0NB10_TOLOC|nr:hypothetical protein TOPH_03980 [Tolypocladium ophioglossoides CBS 100239]
MDCDICHRGHDAQRLPFLCAVDARNQIYDGRIKNLQLFFENEKLQRDANDVAADTARPGKDAMDLALAQQHLAEDRTDQILAVADRLREEIQAARDEAKARRAALARRKSDLASAADGLQERRARQQHELDKSTQMARFRWSQGAENMARTRSFLCTEAIRLYGLKRTRKGAAGRYEYHIGRIPVVDLTSMDSLTPEVISTSLAHVAHILMLVSHYLAIRLPAEITLPHRDYPRPTIFNLSSSYQHGPVPFPSGPASTTSSSQPRDPDSHHVPRPRPLFVDKPLPQLSKEDPPTYSFFLEGATLLAYDVAWLCSCQGVSIGDKGSFEDMCHMGRNLYTFLLAAQLQGYESLSVKTIAGKRGNVEDEGADSQANWIGRYSHGTMYYFLGGVEGTDFARTFKLPSPMKLADRLKKKLLSDAPAADWEVLDDEAWKVDEGPNEDGAVHGVSGVVHQAKDLEGKASPRTGSNGWTKVKHRS